MRLKLIATFFFLGSYLSAQQTVTTSGGEIKSNQVSLSYTIGQIKVNTIEKVDSSIPVSYTHLTLPTNSGV